YGVQQREPGTKQESAKDRTRSLALLIGGTIGAVLLFIGVFSTPATRPIRETGGRAAPNLGRPSAQNQSPTTSRSSVTPLLNADVASGDASPDQLSAVDIEGTSRRPPADESTGSREAQPDAHANRAPIPQAGSFGGSGLPSGAGPDP